MQLEVAIILTIIALLITWGKRNWILQYFTNYKSEMKKAIKGELKEQSPMELVSFDKNKVFMYAVVIIHTVLFFFFPWYWVLLSFVAIYFGVGLLLMTYVWSD